MSDAQALRVREAKREDYPVFVRMQELLGLDYEPLPEESWWRNLAPWSFFLEDGRGAVAGYGMCKAYGARGDVRQVAVEPAWRRRGVGRRVLAEMARRLGAAGCADWSLEVERENQPAIALYRGLGMQVTREVEVYRAEVAALRAAAGDAGADWRLEPAAVAEEAALERRFDLYPGKLARLRDVRPNARAWVLRRHPGEAEAAALTRLLLDFQPEMALLFPVCVDGEAAATALLPLLLAREAAALPARLELFVPAGSALAGACRRAGAERAAAVLEMRGPLPR